MKQMTEKRITIISTGGTIAMGVDPKAGGAVPLLSGEDLLKNLPSLRDIARVDIVDFCNKPGPHLLLNDVLEISKVIQNLFEQNNADGVVITQGTDTIEETAYALDLLVQSDNPVVVTGAMRNASQISADGSANLFNAILDVYLEGDYIGKPFNFPKFEVQIHPDELKNGKNSEELMKVSQVHIDTTVYMVDAGLEFDE